MLTPGGSSSGPGIAVASNLVTIAIGTETSGSILSPGTANMVVGIKPTLGLVSRTGILPITADQDTAGPLARNVADVAALLGVIAGFDPADGATAPCLQEGKCFSDYTQFLDRHALRGARIAVPHLPYLTSLTADQLNVITDAIAVMRSSGRVRRRSCTSSQPGGHRGVWHLHLVPGADELLDSADVRPEARSERVPHPSTEPADAHPARYRRLQHQPPRALKYNQDIFLAVDQLDIIQAARTRSGISRIEQKIFSSTRGGLDAVSTAPMGSREPTMTSTRFCSRAIRALPLPPRPATRASSCQAACAGPAADAAVPRRIRTRAGAVRCDVLRPRVQRAALSSRSP